MRWLRFFSKLIVITYLPLGQAQMEQERASQADVYSRFEQVENLQVLVPSTQSASPRQIGLPTEKPLDILQKERSPAATDQSKSGPGFPIVLPVVPKNEKI